MVVITGASSGFGRASALAFARVGARMSLAARGDAALEDTARVCSGKGLSPSARRSTSAIPLRSMAWRKTRWPASVESTFG